MLWIAHLVRRLVRTEDGQSLALFGAAGIAVVASVGLAVDVGQVVGTRTQMQKAADAAVFAAAQELPSRDAAVDSAHSFVHKNSDYGTDHEFTVSSTRATNDTITVTAKKRVNYTFMRVVGLSGTTVSAKATARRGWYSGGFGIVPWGFIQSNDPNSALLQNKCYIGSDAQGLPIFQTQTSCTMKFGTGYKGSGDFGALRIDPGTSGSTDYLERVKTGSKLAHRIGEVVDSETGNMQGPTSSGVQYRLDQPAPTGCPGTGRDDVLISNRDGTVTIRPGCESSPRIIVLPVVNQINNGEGSTLLGFVTMFLTGQTGNGGNTTVQGEFIRIVSPLPGGEYNGTNTNAASAIFLIK